MVAYKDKATTSLWWVIIDWFSVSVQALSYKVCEFDCYCPVKVFICNFTEYSSRRMRLTFIFTSVFVKPNKMYAVFSVPTIHGVIK